MASTCLIIDSTYLQCAIVRKELNDFASRFFQGWNDQLDQQHDNRALWFILPHRQEILCVTRVIFKRYINEKGLLPFEKGLQREVAEIDDCEISGVCFKKKEHFYQVLTNVLPYLEKIKIRKCYTLLNPKSNFFNEVHNILMAEKSKYPPVAFSGFTYINTNEEVEWDIMELSPENFPAAVETLNSLITPIDPDKKVAWLFQN